MFNGTYAAQVEIKLYAELRSFNSSVFVFKDTFRLYQIVNGTQKQVPFDGKGIAWWTDYNIKYRNPSVVPLKDAFNGSNFKFLSYGKHSNSR